jgi:DNA invertase Pin-like site-specific DNA recombinase
MIASVGVLNRVGRPPVTVEPEQVHQLRSQGLSWRRIAKALGIGTTTAMRLFKSCSGGRSNIQEIRPKTSDQI